MNEEPTNKYTYNPSNPNQDLVKETTGGSVKQEILSYQFKQLQAKQVDDKQILEDKIAVMVGDGKKSLQDETNRLKEQISKVEEETKRNIERYRDEVGRIDRFNTGVTIVVVIAFLTTMFLVFFDLIKEKDLYLRYNDLYKDYFDKNSDLSNEISQQRIELNDLKNQMKIYEKR